MKQLSGGAYKSYTSQHIKLLMSSSTKYPYPPHRSFLSLPPLLPPQTHTQTQTHALLKIPVELHILASKTFPPTPTEFAMTFHGMDGYTFILGTIQSQF